MQYIQAFIMGGAICAVAQVLIDKTKLTRRAFWSAVWYWVSF